MSDAGARPTAPTDAPAAAPAAPSAPRRPRRPGGVAFLLLAVGALGVGLAVWRPLPPGVWHDDGVYLLLGRALAAGEGLRYVGVPGDLAAPKFPPVYPAVVALAWRLGGDAGGATAAAVAMNVLFLAAAVGLVGAWAWRGLGLPLVVALAVAGVAGLSVDLWSPALVPLSEPLYVLVMAGALWAAARAERPGAGRREIVALVALLALLLHVRTAGVAVAGAAVLGLAARRRWRAAVAVGAALGALALPWALWSASAAAALPEPLRDILGTYGSWLGGGVAGDPLGYAARLPAAAAGVTRRVLDLLVPPAPPALWWVAAPAVGVAAAAGIPFLARRSPTAALALVLSVAMAWLWPYQDRRILLPALPLLLASLGCLAAALAGAARSPLGAWGREAAGEAPERAREAGGAASWQGLSGKAPGAATDLPGAGGPGGARVGGGRRARLAAVALGALVLWAVAFCAGSAVRLARGGATAAYEVRAARLGDALASMEGRVPGDAVVGAPELWAAVPLLTGWRAAPSARFLPLGGGGDRPRQGTPEQQFRLWAAAGIDHLLLEQGGTVHGEALNALEAACPGAVHLLDSRPGLLLVRLAWDDACRRRVGAVP